MKIFGTQYRQFAALVSVSNNGNVTLLTTNDKPAVSTSTTRIDSSVLVSALGTLRRGVVCDDQHLNECIEDAIKQALEDAAHDAAWRAAVDGRE